MRTVNLELTLAVRTARANDGRYVVVAGPLPMLLTGKGDPEAHLDAAMDEFTRYVLRERGAAWLRDYLRARDAEFAMNVDGELAKTTHQQKRLMVTA